MDEVIFGESVVNWIIRIAFLALAIGALYFILRLFN